MKTIFASFFLLLAMSMNAQSSWLQVGVATGVDVYKHDYTYRGGSKNISVDEKKSQGYFVGIRAGMKLGNQFSLRTGLGYGEKHFYPQLSLGFAYGPLAVGFSETLLWNPYLYEHHFKSLEIPLMMYFKPAFESKIKPVFSSGVNASFQFFESEIYQGSGGIVDESHSQIAIDNHDFKTFGISLDAGVGISYELLETLSIELMYRASALEFREGNEKWKGNNEMLYEDSWMWLSKMGGELTILKSF